MPLKFREGGVTKEVIDNTSFIDAIYPVGTYYTQYPDAHSSTASVQFPAAQEPENMFGGTWTPIWNSNATGQGGLFFRTQGTGGYDDTDSDIASGTQQDQMQRITGYKNSFQSSRISPSGAGVGALAGSSGNYTRRESTGNDHRQFFNLDFNSDNSPNARASSATSGETRPTNKKIRLWKRTS